MMRHFEVGLPELRANTGVESWTRRTRPAATAMAAAHVPTRHAPDGAVERCQRIWEFTRSGVRNDAELSMPESAGPDRVRL